MRSLLSVTIDAGVLAVPPLGCSREEVFQYVHTLWDCRQLRKTPWIRLCMSEQTAASLDGDGLYPLRTQLRALFDAHGIMEYDANTVATIAERFLTITPSFEERYRIRDVLSERLQTEPDVLHLTPHDCLRADLARCLTLIAVLRKHCSLPPGGHALFLRQAPKRMIQVRAQIHDIDHDRDDIPVLPRPPAFFEGDALVCDSFPDLIECMDESALLVDASDDEEIELAVRVALFKRLLEDDGHPDWDAVSVPAIGGEFRALCQRICAEQGVATPPKILRAVVETMRGENLQTVHALRIGERGNNPQRTRGSDKAKAQRRDIDRGLHLHYWERPDGAVELASVARHDDYSIPE